MTTIELLPGEVEIWRGRQWVVTSLGLQPHENKQQGYWIEASRLNEMRPASDGGTRSDWLLHLVEKDWADLEDFIAAFCVAIAVHKTKLGKIDVRASIADARALDQHYRELFERRTGLTQGLRRDDVRPLSLSEALTALGDDDGYEPPPRVPA
jgi:hypothetical protein